MEAIKVVNSPVYFQDQGYDALKKHIYDQDYSSIFVLADSNTINCCLPRFKSKLGNDFKYEVLSVPAGEEHKNIESCIALWRDLSEKGADRKSVLINLGGGVVTDLGGFVASVFKRGMDFIHVPTSLLAMVDAAIGGKTGVDLDNLKNQLGVIRHPHMVLVDTGFLETLPSRHWNNGKAEMWKHGLISDRGYWEAMKEFGDLESLVYRSVALKAGVVNQDPEEGSLRKTLNYGHTLGHGIESYFLASAGADGLLHGEAIVIGMIMEAYLAVQHAGLSSSELDEISTTLLDHYPKTTIETNKEREIIKLLKHDKKNRKGKVKFVLLDSIGEATLDHTIPDQSLLEAFAY